MHILCYWATGSAPLFEESMLMLPIFTRFSFANIYIFLVKWIGEKYCFSRSFSIPSKQAGKGSLSLFPSRGTPATRAACRSVPSTGNSMHTSPLEFQFGCRLLPYTTNQHKDNASWPPDNCLSRGLLSEIVICVLNQDNNSEIFWTRNGVFFWFFFAQLTGSRRNYKEHLSCSKSYGFCLTCPPNTSEACGESTHLPAGGPPMGSCPPYLHRAIRREPKLALSNSSWFYLNRHSACGG